MSAHPAARLLAALALAAGLAACGKQGSLRPPPDADPDFPRQYPNPETVLPETPEDAGSG